MEEVQNKIEDHCSWKADRLTKEVIEMINDKPKPEPEVISKEQWESIKEIEKRAKIRERMEQTKLV